QFVDERGGRLATAGQDRPVGPAVQRHRVGFTLESGDGVGKGQPSLAADDVGEDILDRPARTATRKGPLRIGEVISEGKQGIDRTAPLSEKWIDGGHMPSLVL